jgi:hypothetical protein
MYQQGEKDEKFFYPVTNGNGKISSDPGFFVA